MKMKSALRKIMVPLFLGMILLLSCSSDEKIDDTGFSSLEDEVFALINAHRTDMSLPALVKENVITTEARKHSENMADGSVAYGHDGFLDRINAIKLTLTVTASAENVLMGVGEAEAIVNSWLASSGHKANIEGSYTKTGIGIAKSSDNIFYCTQIFTKP